MGSFWHSLKVEETNGRGFETREEAKRCVLGYIDGFCNTARMLIKQLAITASVSTGV